MIESTIAVKESESVFPKLMEATNNPGRVVLFSKNGSGTVIKECSKDMYKVGYWSAGWCMTTFKNFNEPITLRNV